MQMGQSKHGMQTMNQSLLKLYQDGLITREEAMIKAGDNEEMMTLLSS
jgi:twitching motility protein PilT